MTIIRFKKWKERKKKPLLVNIISFQQKKTQKSNDAQLETGCGKLAFVTG